MHISEKVGSESEDIRFSIVTKVMNMNIFDEFHKHTHAHTHTNRWSLLPCVFPHLYSVEYSMQLVFFF